MAATNPVLTRLLRSLALALGTGVFPEHPAAAEPHLDRRPGLVAPGTPRH